MHSFAWWPTVLVLGVATFTDLRSRRIPNWLVFPFCLRPRGFGLAARLARRGAESFWSGTWAADLRVSILDGRNGRGRRKTLRRDWSMDWPLPVDFGAGDDWPGGRSDGACGGGVGWILEGTVSAHRRSGIQRARTRRSGLEQSAATQDTLRTGDRDRDIDFVFCTLKTGHDNVEFRASEA